MRFWRSLAVRAHWRRCFGPALSPRANGPCSELRRWAHCWLVLLERGHEPGLRGLDTLAISLFLSDTACVGALRCKVLWTVGDKAAGEAKSAMAPLGGALERLSALHALSADGSARDNGAPAPARNAPEREAMRSAVLRCFLRCHGDALSP